VVLVERYVFHEDLGKPGGERLLAWCRSLGADSFTFTVIGTPPELEQQAAVIEAPLESFRISPTRIRAIPEGQPGSYWTQLSVLWELNDTTEAYLLKCFSGGLVTYETSNGSWCEDPCLYRGDALMLGIISHESEGVLRIEAREQLELDQSELPYRLNGRYVGY
jgi:hypothetical protein